MQDVPSPLQVVEAGGGRARILEEAAELFLRRGYAQTSLRHIAAAAGMKAGSVYYHFGSKEEILAEILRRGIEVVTASFEETRASLPDGIDPRERLRSHLRAHLAALFAHHPFTAAHVSVFPTAPEAVRRAGVPMRDGYEQRWAELLDELAEAGALAPGLDLTLHRLLLLGAANSALEWFDPAGEHSLDHLADVITRQFWSGVGVAPDTV